MVWAFVFSIVIPLIILFYVLHSLSTIKHQLNTIINHLGIEEKEEVITNEQIEKELEDELLK